MSRPAFFFKNQIHPLPQIYLADPPSLVWTSFLVAGDIAFTVTSHHGISVTSLSLEFKAHTANLGHLAVVHL